MSKHSIFIGREKELKMIDEMLFDPTEANHIWPIIGEGGVGKTWLLREICHRYQSHSSVFVIKIDHGEARSQSWPSLMMYIMEQLVPYTTKSQKVIYEKKLHELEELAKSNTTTDKIKDKEEEIFSLVAEWLLNISKIRRILVLSDTTDAIKSLEIGDRIKKLDSYFSNFVCVLAGRPTSTIKEGIRTLPQIYQNCLIKEEYHLKPFSSHEATQYFDEFLSWQMPQDLREKIFLLTDGNPVLIAIAGEWLTRHIALPDYVDLPLEDLRLLAQEELTEYRELFEFLLLEKVLDLRKPIDWAVLYLAFLNRRYDPKILQLTLDLDDAELEAITEELKTLAFVRKSMSTEVGLLHDEAQHLILRHAWPVADPDGAIRRELAQQVIDEYYLPEIERLDKIVQASPPIPDEDWLKRELQMECLDYHFRTSLTLTAGWTYLDQLIDEAQNYHYSLIQMAAIEHAMTNLWLDKVDPVRYRVRMARLLLQKREVEQARRFAQEALDDSQITPADAAMARSVLAKMASDVTPV